VRVEGAGQAEGCVCAVDTTRGGELVGAREDRGRLAAAAEVEEGQALVEHGDGIDVRGACLEDLEGSLLVAQGLGGAAESPEILADVR
jgi:hypothetical protein